MQKQTTAAAAKNINATTVVAKKAKVAVVRQARTKVDYVADCKPVAKVAAATIQLYSGNKRLYATTAALFCAALGITPASNKIALARVMGQFTAISNISGKDYTNDFLKGGDIVYITHALKGIAGNPAHAWAVKALSSINDQILADMAARLVAQKLAADIITAVQAVDKWLSAYRQAAAKAQKTA
jgi:hypothetical protein